MVGYMQEMKASKTSLELDLIPMGLSSLIYTVHLNTMNLTVFQRTRTH